MSAKSPEKEKNPAPSEGKTVEEKTADEKMNEAEEKPTEKKVKEAEEKPTEEKPDEKASEEMKLKEALGNLAAGKRNLLVNDVPAAVNAFAEACKMMGEVYGETAAECGESFFYYGKSLLEMARLENGVLENGLGGVPDGEDKECSNIEDPEKMSEVEREEVAEKVGDALETNFQDLEEAKKKAEQVDKKAEQADKEAGQADKKAEQADKANDGKKDESSENSAAEEDGDEEEGKEAEEKGDEAEMGDEEGGDDAAAEDGEGGENESIGSNEAGPSTAKETEDKSAVEAEDDDDPSSLQLAWEMLELAKQCLKKQADSLPADDTKRNEVEGRLSETYMKLGEVSIESENYPQAIEDLNACLRRHQEHLPDDSRCIAETHYQIGVALGFNLEFDKAVASLEDAIAVLEKRVQNLKDKKESQDPVKKEDAFYTREKEIEEISGLVPEIREKIADTRDMQVETNKKLGDRVLAEEKEMEAITGGSPTKKSVNGVGVKSSTNGNGVAAAEGDTNGKTNDTNGKTNDISHMVKKRKKSDVEDGAAEPKRVNCT